jgi:hypothetical protein
VGLASDYVSQATDIGDLFNTLDSFYEVCDKVFWGPRSRAKRQVGPKHPDIEGYSDLSFMTWLLFEMREQLL